MNGYNMYDFGSDKFNGAAKVVSDSDYISKYLNEIQKASGQSQLGKYAVNGLTKPAGNSMGWDNLMSRESLLGTAETPGLLQTGVGALGSIYQAWQGAKQLGLARDTYNTNTAFSKANLANQASLTNTQMEDRQRSRLAYQGITGNSPELEAYMTKNRVKGTI